MNKSLYNQMITQQEQAHANAWRFVFDAWTCSEWRPLPQAIKATLNLHPALGVCGGMLVTRTGANGLNDFVARMNSRHTQ